MLYSSTLEAFFLCDLGRNIACCTLWIYSPCILTVIWGELYHALITLVLPYFPNWSGGLLSREKCFWLVDVNFPRGTTLQKYYSDLCSDMSSEYGISVLVSHTSFCGETSGDVVKCGYFLTPGTLITRLFQPKKWQTASSAIRSSRFFLSNLHKGNFQKHRAL